MAGFGVLQPPRPRSAHREAPDRSVVVSTARLCRLEWLGVPCRQVSECGDGAKAEWPAGEHRDHFPAAGGRHRHTVRARSPAADTHAELAAHLQPRSLPVAPKVAKGGGFPSLGWRCDSEHGLAGVCTVGDKRARRPLDARRRVRGGRRGHQLYPGAARESLLRSPATVESAAAVCPRRLSRRCRRPSASSARHPLPPCTRRRVSRTRSHLARPADVHPAPTSAQASLRCPVGRSPEQRKGS